MTKGGAMAQISSQTARETLRPGGNRTVVINRDLCTGCGSCVDMCPQRILSLDERDGTCVVSDEDRCDRLAGCQRICPTGAIRITR